jgi:DNA helicase-2/ATP-dependent DNA helicase PcrA
LPSLVEESFKMNFGPHQVRGRWDRVDMDGSWARIIDYKTGEVKNQKEAKQKAGESLQLMIYALAFGDRFGRRPDELLLHFVKSGSCGVLVPDADRLAHAQDKISQVAEAILKEQFNAAPGYHCRWCPYERICPEASRTG